jgi:hypothetical protein
VISHEDIAIAEYIVSKSGAFAVLSDGLERCSRGRKPSDRMLELLLLGLLLSIQDRGVATVKGAWRTLTESIPWDEQLRLGTCRVEGDVREPISYRDLAYQASRIRDRLAYGERSTPDLDDEERTRRRKVINAFSNTLMDCFDFGWDCDVFAMDATGIWSWGKGGKRRDAASEEEVEGETPEVAEAFRKFCQEGEVSAGTLVGPTPVLAATPSESAKEDTNVKRPRSRRRSRIKPDPAMESEADSNGRVDDGLGYTTSVDPDGNWSIKTSKAGKRESFFGYHEHTLVLAPAERIADNPKVVPALIRRLELTTASQDIVEVSLRLIEGLNGAVGHLIVDMHYHYKKTWKWLDELTKLGVKQHHDLRSDEQGFTDYERVRYAGGWPHCPATPDSYGVITKPAVIASRADKNRFREDVNAREPFSLMILQHPTSTLPMRGVCPALAGKVGCANCPGTTATAQLKGQPIIENPPNEAIDGEPLPKVCRKGSVTLRPPEKVRKLHQIHYWGGQAWEKMFARRTYVEGSYGGRKNVSSENMRRGQFQSMGLPWANVVVSLVAASYNLRLLQNWHDRSGDGDPNHPLLRRSTGVRPWMYMSDEDAANYALLCERSIGVSPSAMETE